MIIMECVSGNLPCIGVVGVGVVGSALLKSFDIKQIKTISFDKYKTNVRDGYAQNLKDCLVCDILFLCLPTLINDKDSNGSAGDQHRAGFDKKAIYETCKYLNDNLYQGIVVLKSTVEPGITAHLAGFYNNLKIIHNPEFLSAATAFEDFHNQTHVVLGGEPELTDKVAEFFKKFYPDAKISQCSSVESESMKIFANSFYAVKIQFFNELYLACNHSGADFKVVRDLMLKNGWINPQHTEVPGKDKQLSYGGMCFPKDTVALENYLISSGVPCGVLTATIKERNTMRIFHV